MHYFAFKGNNLYCENFKIKNLAEKFGTPLYVYSAKTIAEHFLKLKRAFKSINPLICYSVKANSNLSLLKLMVAQGAGLDIVSGGELYRGKKVKCPAKKIVYASVGKTEKEIKEAISYGILMFNVESPAELERMAIIAKQLKKKVKVALRFNPDVKPKTHKYITTGQKENKFGMDYETIRDIFAKNLNYRNLDLAGIHIHIGSQITESTPFVKAIRKAKSLIRSLETQAIKIEYLNIGGGLGIVYDNEKPQTALEFATKIIPLFKNLSVKLILEPGRFIIGNAGILVTKVVYVKDRPHKRFIIVDAAMNDLMRPSLYDAYHKIVPLVDNSKHGPKPTKPADVVGPICESGDFLGKTRKLNTQQGDFLAILGAGAYGFSMSSNYNSRPRAAEVLAYNSKIYLIRRRETYKDITAEEVLI